MTKKEYTLKILESLKDDWDLARWLAIAILDIENDELLDDVFKIFNKSINNIKDKKLKEKVSKSINNIEKIKQEEGLSRQKDLEDLEKIKNKF